MTVHFSSIHFYRIGMKALKALFTAFLFLSCFFPAFSFAQGGNLVIVVDSSGSMWGRLDGFIKMDLAKSSLNDALQNIQGEPNVGLMAFGHRRTKDCTDIELMESLGKIDKEALTSKVSSLKPKGKTPLETTIRMAVDEVQKKGEKATILIISDGKDTCNGDPCAIAKKLKEESETDFVIDVIGLVSQMNGTGKTLSEESYTQLKCITDATGGTFYSVDNARDFRLAVAESIAQEAVVEPEPEPEPVKPSGFTTDDEGWVDLLNDTSEANIIIDAATVIKAGFVDEKENVSTVGRITGVNTRQDNVYLYDKVTVKLDTPAKIGDKFLAYDIFRATGDKTLYSINLPFNTDVRDSNGDNMGELHDINGLMEITKILGGGTYQAQMIQYFDNVLVGAPLMLFDTAIVNPPQDHPYLKKPDRNYTDAEIIATYKQNVVNGYGDIVYINKGKNQKVLIGDNFDVYPDEELKVEKKGVYPDVGETLKEIFSGNKEPNIERAGVLTVIGLRKNTAIGYIIQSDRKIISTGYRLELIQD